MKKSFITALLIATAMLAPAAHAQSYDPWRNTNERIFRFNDYFDTILVRPLAQGYTTFVPRFLRQGIGNFFSNLNDINVFVNNVLQLKLEDAASDGGRFVINSTIGVAGVFDVASEWGLDKN